MIFEIASGETALNIPKLRRNGFGDSGNMVELGYGVLAKGNKFAGADYRNVFMLMTETQATRPIYRKHHHQMLAQGREP